MLGVALFIAFWAILALIVFLIAGMGGRRRTPQAPGRRLGRGFGLILAVLYVGFGIALPAILLRGNNANANRRVGEVKLTAAERKGRELFAFRCGFCHTLAAASAVGKVGPNLDELKPSKAVVLNTIANGCLQSPPPGSKAGCLGQGTMPAGVVQGQEANQVASFVAAVAGKE